MNKTKKNYFQKQKLKELGYQEHADGKFHSRVSICEHPKTQGVKIRTGKELGNKFSEHRYGIWIPKLNTPTWLYWIIKSLNNLTSKHWKEKLDPLVKIAELQKQEEALLDNIVNLTQDKQLLQNSLKEKSQQLELAKLMTDNISVYEEAFNNLEVLIKKSKKKNIRNEGDIKKHLMSHKWLLGIDCEVKAKEKNIDSQTNIDMHITNNFNQDKIFEFKSPNLFPFRKKAKERLEIDNEFAQGLNQLIDYMRRVDIYSQNSNNWSYGVERPLGTLFIGYKLEGEKLLFLSWAYHLQPIIQLRTYDDLLASAKEQLENIRFAKNTKFN